MTNQSNNLMQLIQTAESPDALVDNQPVADRFKELYMLVHGIKNPLLADAFYAAEKHHFLNLINNSVPLQQCTRLSLYGIFMDVAVSGLSFDPSMKHLYIVPYNTNVGTKDKPNWEKRAALQISGYGELLLRQIQGQVKYADNPVVVYEGDEFRFGTRDGRTIIDHMAAIPRTTDNIIACFICITRHDDSKDYKVMTMEDIRKLQKFSKDPNSLAWTSGLSGMVAAKTIKHAFKNYPKVRIGEFSKLQTEVIDEEIEQLSSTAIDYGLPEGQQQQAQLPEATSVPFSMPQQPQAQAMPVNNGQQQPQQMQQPQQQPAELNF